MQSKINPTQAQVARDNANAPWTREQVLKIKESTVDTTAAEYVDHLGEYTSNGYGITIHFPALHTKLAFHADNVEIVEALANLSHHVANELATVFISGIQTTETDNTAAKAIKNENIGAKMIFNKTNLHDKVK
eukprot:gene9911-1787_t